MPRSRSSVGASPAHSPSSPTVPPPQYPGPPRIDNSLFDRFLDNQVRCESLRILERRDKRVSYGGMMIGAGITAIAFLVWMLFFGRRGETVPPHLTPGKSLKDQVNSSPIDSANPLNLSLSTVFYRLYTPTAPLTSKHPSAAYPQDKNLGHAPLISFIPPYTASSIQNETLKLEGRHPATLATLILNGTTVGGSAEHGVYASLLEARDPYRPLVVVLQNEEWRSVASLFGFPASTSYSNSTSESPILGIKCSAIKSIIDYNPLIAFCLWWMFGWKVGIRPFTLGLAVVLWSGCWTVDW